MNIKKYLFPCCLLAMLMLLFVQIFLACASKVDNFKWFEHGMRWMRLVEKVAVWIVDVSVNVSQGVAEVLQKVHGFCFLSKLTGVVLSEPPRWKTSLFV